MGFIQSATQEGRDESCSLSFKSEWDVHALHSINKVTVTSQRSSKKVRVSVAINVLTIKVKEELDISYREFICKYYFLVMVM